MDKDGQRINNVATCNEQSTPQKSNNLILMRIDEGPDSLSIISIIHFERIRDNVF